MIISKHVLSRGDGRYPLRMSHTQAEKLFASASADCQILALRLERWGAGDDTLVGFGLREGPGSQDL